ncbi:MAG: hypothetical protein JW936_08225 [Sedimentisphaerales bacterium]|nr:hypothetical protein [Sedimentisphaerales bacterium]
MPEFIDGLTCLNGWWDFCPSQDDDVKDMPLDGWCPSAFLVPGFWSKSPDGVRKPGHRFFDVDKDYRNYTEQDEFLFDGFGYPAEWSQSRSAWIRRTIGIDGIQPGKRWFILLEGVCPRMMLFVNGRQVCQSLHPTLPCQADITDYVKPGINEIVVHVIDYHRGKDGRATTPTGNVVLETHCGIWQDVWLIEKSDLHISDLTIRTSIRQKLVELIYEVTNLSGCDRCVTLKPEIIDWHKTTDPKTVQSVLALPQEQIAIPAGQTVEFSITQSWSEPQLWNPENPKLYQIRTEVVEDDTKLETHLERFGFREVWIEGPDLILNGYPIHLFSDWGHKSTPYYYTEAWVRQWFGMIRDGNMNHTRLHTHPHPSIILDLADELGIMITDEAGLHGSGNAQGVDEPEYWTNAADHITRFVKRDKNHPSVILWSVGNEMRWNQTTNDSVRREMPGLRELFHRLDPSRYAYFEGDSSLWDETGQDIISRHYGKECSGAGWWDKSKPLHSGEMCSYHYQGPNNTLHISGDSVFADYREMDRAAGIDTAKVIEDGRAVGVCCFGPWNQSSLVNLRPDSEKISLSYDDYSCPGVKPLQVPAHSSEFQFWKPETKGYYTQPSFDIQAYAFRPLAVLDINNRTQYFRGDVLSRRLHVVNDTCNAVKGVLEVTVENSTGSVFHQRFETQIDRGRQCHFDIEWDIATDMTPGHYRYQAQFISGDQVLDSWRREIKIAINHVREKQSLKIDRKIGVFGVGTIQPKLCAMGLDPNHVSSLTLQALDGIEILILEKDSAPAEDGVKNTLQQFLQQGGRLIVLESMFSIFPQLPLEDKPVLTSFFRAIDHPLLAELNADDVCYWGDDPFSQFSGDSYVAMRMYRKKDCLAECPILDSGEGGFGIGDLEYSPLVEIREGRGLAIGCQMRVSEKIDRIPAAETLLINMLKRADQYIAAQSCNILEVWGNDVSAIEAVTIHAAQGGTAVVNNIPANMFEKWSHALGLELKPAEAGEIFQAVRVNNHPAISGVSNEDICGIGAWTYTRDRENVIVAECAITPAPGIESILETPQTSCLRELFQYGGKSEALRAHTVSRFCYGNEKSQPGIIFGVVKHGRGTIYINQFAPQNNQLRLSRFYNRLMANLNPAADCPSLFEGTYEDLFTGSNGKPDNLLIANLDSTDNICKVMNPSAERLLSMVVRDIIDWKALRNAQGRCSAEGFDTNRPIAVYMAVQSPTPRKSQKLNVELPNPELLTFIDITGSGTVEVFVNAKLHDTLELTNGHASANDVELEMGINHVLLMWQGMQPDSELTIAWRNIMHQPERFLMFH